MTLRLGLVGGGWISRQHLDALQRLGRTELVGVVAGSRATADEVTGQWGGTSYDDLDRMLEAGRPDVVYVAVPPHRAVAVAERLVAHRIPFLTEKPLSATDADGPARLADGHRAEPARRRRRLPPAGARHHGRGPGTPGRAARPAVRGALAGFDAGARLVGPDRRGRRPGHRAGDPPVRPRAVPRRRGDRGRRRVDPRPRDRDARRGRRRQQRGRHPLRDRARSGRSRTRAGSRRPSSRSRSSRTAS